MKLSDEVRSSAHPTDGSDDAHDWADRIDKYETALAEIREVWAGSEGGEPVTCQEAYFKRLAKQCYEIAVGALK